jgi:hypothetical protein
MTSRPQDFSGRLSMIYPHELFGVIYTHYRDFFFEYIAPATEIIDKFWEQVAGVINFVFLGFLSPYDSYESQVSFESEGPTSFLWNPTPICASLCFLGNCAKVRHNSNPTRRLLVEICPKCCLWQYMVMGHPFVELENRGRRWAISFLGAACWWPQATVNWAGSWYSWSMLIWGAQILCLRSDDSIVYFLCLLTSNIMYYASFALMFFFSLFQVHEVCSKHDGSCLRHHEVEFCCPQWRQVAGARLAWRSHRLLEKDGRGLGWILF